MFITIQASGRSLELSEGVSRHCPRTRTEVAYKGGGGVGVGVGVGVKTFFPR